MAGIKIPIVPIFNLCNACVCTPDGGILYVGARSANFIGNCGKSDLGSSLQPQIKEFPMGQKILGIDIDPNWSKGASEYEITASKEAKGPRVGCKHFAILALDNSIQIWDFDQECPIMGHKAHFKRSGVNSVLFSYMQNGSVLSMDSQGLIIYCTESNLYSRKTTYFLTGNGTMTILRCSPHNENVFAVGTKRGDIIIGELQKMSVIYILSGHSSEITSLSWCPRNEDAIKLCLEKPLDKKYKEQNDELNAGSLQMALPSVNTSQTPQQNKDELSSKKEVSHILLASASIDGNVWIWNTETGAGCDNVHLSNRSKLFKDKNNTVVWLSSSQLVIPNKAGELSYWTIIFEADAQHRYKLKENKNHTFQQRDVIYVSVDRNRGLLWCISLPRDISCEDLESRELLVKFSCASPNVSVMRECPDNMNRIALGFSDNSVGIIDLSNLSPRAVHIDNYEANIESSVVSLVWSSDSQKIAFGTLRGRVGVFNVETKKCVVLKSSSAFPIYSMDWKYSQIFAVCNKILTVYDDNCESKDARVITEVQNASCISVQFDKLLVGTEQGRLHVYHRKDVPHNSYELIQDIELTNRYIKDIAWCPIKSKIAVVAKSNSIHILKHIPENGTLCLIQKTVIKNEKATNFCAKWSNEEPYQLLTCACDGGIRVWDFNSSNACEIFFKQFQCPMKSGLFLPTDEKILMCSGTSTSIELIDMRAEENMTSTNGKVELSKKPRDDCVKWALGVPLDADKQPKVPWKPLDVDDRIVANDKSNENVADLMASFKIDKSELLQTQTVPPGPKQTQANLFSVVTNELNGEVLTEIKDIVQRPTEKQLQCSKLFGSISEVSPREPLDVDDRMGTNDKSNENVTDQMASFQIDESELHQTQSVPPGSNQTQANVFSLITSELNGDVLTEIKAFIQKPTEKKLHCSKLFGSISEAKELLARELNQNQTMESASITDVLMPETIKGEIIRCIQEKKLAQWHVSLAPTISFKFWQKCCEAFADQLLEQGCALQAASHLMALNRTAKAIEMLVSGNYYKEALLIGRIYLEPDDTLLSTIVDKWILRLDCIGNLYGAALICILSGQFDRALKMLSKVRETSEDIEEVIKILRTKRE